MCRKWGRIVQVNGALSPKSALAGSNNGVTMFTLPEGYRPIQASSFVQHGSGMNKWLCSCNPAGQVTFARYGTNALATAPVGAWLPFTLVFIAG